jgi:hypothetical protein
MEANGAFTEYSRMQAGPGFGSVPPVGRQRSVHLEDCPFDPCGQTVMVSEVCAGCANASAALMTAAKCTAAG